jgi:dienelactone hydrolase
VDKKSKFGIFLIFIFIISLTVLVDYQALNGIKYEVVELSESGYQIIGIYAVPEGDWETGELPAVSVFHGFSATKEIMRPFIEGLVRRGIAVLAVDALGHGESSGGIDDDNARTITGLAAISFLRQKREVNISRIGMLGHSMGGAIVLETAQQDTSIQAHVIIGNPIENFEDDQILANTTHPANLLVATGKFDELVSIDKVKENFETIIDAPKVQTNQIYGSHDLGTARKLVIADTGHVFEILNPIIVEESIEWLHDSLVTELGFLGKGVGENTNGWHFVFAEFLSLIAGLAWLLIPGMFFFIFKGSMEYDNTEIRWKSHGLVSVSAFILAFPFIFTLPVMFSGLFIGWFIIGGSIYGYMISKHQEEGLIATIITTVKSSRLSLVRGFLSFLILFVPLEILLFFVPWDFRYVLPLFSFLSWRRLVLMAAIWVVGVFFFTLEMKALGGGSYFIRKTVGQSILARNWPYLVILGIYYLPVLVLQNNIFPEFVGILPFFLLGFVPVMVIISIMSILAKYFGHELGTIAIFNAGFVAWILSSTIPFS